MISIQLMNKALGTGVSVPVSVGLTSYIGPRGPAGADGADGAQGPQGPQGPAGPVAGTDKQVIFNDGGAPAGNAGLTFDKATGALDTGRVNASAGLRVLGDYTGPAAGLILTYTAAGGRIQSYAGLPLQLNPAGNPVGIFAGGLSFNTGGACLFGAVNQTIEQRNGANAQAFHVYENYTDSANYGRAVMRVRALAYEFGGEAAGTGVARAVRILAPTGSMFIQSSPSTVMYRIQTGSILPENNNTADLGDGVSRSFRTGYFGTSVVAPYVKVGPFTVATLPSASTAGGGAMTYATDLASLANGTTAAGGGAFKGIVKSDGTNWIVLG